MVRARQSSDVSVFRSRHGQLPTRMRGPELL